MLNLRTFGGCHLERDGVRLDEVSSQRKALALLALLAFAGARGVSRDVAAALLWPESDDARSRASLKQLVHALRTRLAEPDVLLTSGDLRLNPSLLRSDVGAFRDALATGDRAAAARLQCGPFLDGFYLRGAPEFEHWVSEQRSVLARELRETVRRLAEDAVARGDHHAAVVWWRQLADSDPLSASATLGLMRALDAAGERAGAIRQAGSFRDAVRRELAAEPDSAVMELAALLRNGAESATSRPVLVVLPLVNTSGNPEDEQFCDGLTDELIGTIGKMRGIAVVGRTSAFAFKGARADLAELATRLRATSVLEGSVRRFGERIKVGVQLVRAPEGVVLWSEIYDRHARDLFAVQADIARAVSLALRGRLDPDVASLVGAGTADTAAQDLYLRGRHFLNRVSVTDIREAVRCFERAVERDATFARAFTGLADAHLVLAIMGHAPAIPEVSLVHAALARALALDGALAEAHATLACVLFAFDWNWNGAAREFERAIQLDAGYGLAHHRYGLFLMYQSRFAEAQEVLENARAADPLAASVNMNLGRLHLAARRPGLALPLLETATELSPQFPLAHEQLGYALLELGAPARALAAFQRVSTLSGPRGATRLAYALAVTGSAAESRALIREVAGGEHATAHAFGLALACTGLGELDDAFAWLDRAHARRDAFLHTIAAMPAFEPLHDDPRWRSLLGRIGLAEDAAS